MKNTRVFNFCAGPAALPRPVMEKAQQEFLDWQGCGASIMEFSHRSDEFQSIAKKAELDLREILSIPEHYKVLFMHGGATAQFAMVPLNLAGIQDSAVYLDTGLWSKKAIKEAERHLKHVAVISPENLNVSVPLQESLDAYFCAPVDGGFNRSLNGDRGISYCHYTPNETIGGVAFHYVPEVPVPLVADMSSVILSEAIDVTKFDLIYAGAQKNIGPAGLTVVIIREDLLEQAVTSIPSTFHYKTAATYDSMFNTPPTYAWYLAGLVFEWIKSQGGVEGISKINRKKSALLYEVIDNSDLYVNQVDERFRSKMNIPFSLARSDLNELFLSKATDKGLIHLQGHRSVGGMRASLYNSMPLEGVEALVEFMKSFELQYG